MISKFDGKKSFMVAVFIGMTMSYAPVQAGCDMKTVKHVVGVVLSQTKKVSKVAFEWVKIGMLISGIVGGSGALGEGLYTFTKKNYNGGNGVQLGVGLSVLILSSLYLYKQEFKPEKKDKNKDNDNDKD